MNRLSSRDHRKIAAFARRVYGLGSVRAIAEAFAPLAVSERAIL